MGVAFNLGLLGYFKYTDFLIGIANDAVATSMPMQGIVLPLAISFFTFQQIAYLVDVYQGKTTDPDFIHYCLFVSFFPQLIAGPIVHHGEIIPQFRSPNALRLDARRIAVGAAIFGIGLYKKVVLADGIAPYADRVFDAGSGMAPGIIDAWSGALAYSFQIYFDFSAYSDMAIGIALIFRIRLPLNFNSPYKAVNIIDFWHRWHMTLSRFLRDYLYFPLGGNRKGRTRRHVNLMVTMLLGGLWHGAGWNFVIWGGLHGLYLVINHFWRGLRAKLGWAPDKPNAMGRVLGCAITYPAVVVAWVFFRAPDLDTALMILRGMVDFATLPATETLIEALSAAGIVWFFVLAAIVWGTPNTAQIFADHSPVIEEKGREASSLAANPWGRALVYRRAWLVPGLLVMTPIAAMVVVARGSDTMNFIYMVF